MQKVMLCTDKFKQTDRQRYQVQYLPVRYAKHAIRDRLLGLHTKVYKLT